MKMTINSRAKRRWILASLILALVLAIVGLFFVQKERKVGITASAENTTFAMKDGMRLNETPNDTRTVFTVLLTQEMWYNLTEDSSDYYLQLVRHEVGTSSGAADIEKYGTIINNDDNHVLFHTDPTSVDYTTTYFSCNYDSYAYGGYYCLLNFSYSTDCEKQYSYTCRYLNNTNGTWSIKATTNTVTCSVSDMAKDALENNSSEYTDEQLAWLQTLAGIQPSGDTVTVNLTYQTLEGYGNFISATDQYSVKSVYAASPDLVYTEVAGIRGINDISDFNVIYEDPYLSKIVLQAESYTYSYDSSSEVGTLTITYRDFDYSNFSIRVQDNDLLDNISLWTYLYSSDVSETTLGSEYRMVFYYTGIESQLWYSYQWIIGTPENKGLTEENFTIVNKYTDYVTVTLYSDRIEVVFAPQNQNYLRYVTVSVVAEIIEDYECTVKVNHAKLSFENDTIYDETLTSEYTMMYSDFMKVYYWDVFTESEYYSLILTALEVEELNGEEYFIPSGLTGKRNEDGSCSLTVKYTYNTLLAIKNLWTGEVHFRACTKNSLTYTYDDLYLSVPNGCRMSGLTSDSNSVAITFSETAPKTLAVKLNTGTKQKLIIPLTAEYTDTWYLIINYMDPYKDTPFAVKTEVQTEVKVADYEDITALTKADIAAILGKTDLKIGDMVDADEKVNVVFDGASTYTATVSYGVASLRQIDYDRNVHELEIPLTSYVDWCASFGKSWTILFLNTEKTQYFKYSNEVDREKLYGFFAVAVFEEQVSDFNYWFRDNTGAGQMTIFSERQVDGSALYEFFGQMTTKGLISKAIGTIGMALCEIFDDSNKIYQSYYFYLDGSEQNGYAYLSNGGADDAFDDDSAFGNTVEDIWNGIKTSTKSWWESFTNSPWSTVVYVALACIAGFVLIGLGYKYVMWLRAPSTKKSKKKKRKK